MLSIDFFTSLPNFSNAAKKVIGNIEDEFSFVDNLQRPVGSIVDKDGEHYTVQPWSQQILDNKLSKISLVNKLGVSLVVAALISLIAAPIIVKIGVSLGLALGIACGYAAIPFSLSIVLLFALAFVAIKVEKQFHQQIIYHLQNAWANPTDFDLANVQNFKPYFPLRIHQENQIKKFERENKDALARKARRANKVANVVTTLQLLQNRQTENAEIFAKMLLGGQIDTLQLTNHRSKVLLKFFEARAILNQIPIIEDRTSINITCTDCNIGDALAADIS